MNLLITINSRSRQLLKMAALAVVLTSLVACGGSPYVDNADRNEIITIGDSIFDLSGDVQMFLEQDAGQTFRNYTQSGAKLDSGLLATNVTQQFLDAQAADSNIATVVMNGGGNDLLIPAMLGDPYGCRTHWWRRNLSRSCKNLADNVYVKAVSLLNQIDAAGVQDIIYMGYYEVPRSNENLGKAVILGVEKMTSACANTVANCTYVNVLGMVPPEHVLADDIHPTIEGSRTLATQVWPHLQPLL